MSLASKSHFITAELASRHMTFAQWKFGEGQAVTARRAVAACFNKVIILPCIKCNISLVLLSPGSAEADVGWGGKLNSHLMASCFRNICTKNRQNPLIPFKVTIDNVGGPFLRHGVEFGDVLWELITWWRSAANTVFCHVVFWREKHLVVRALP